MFLIQLMSESVMSGLTPKWVRLAPNTTNIGLFKIIFQYIFAWQTFLDDEVVMKVNAVVLQLHNDWHIQV